jgi:hypothetical protein
MPCGKVAVPEQVEVGRIGQHRAVKFRCVADALVEAEPELLERWALGRLERVARVDVAELERPSSDSQRWILSGSAAITSAGTAWPASRSSGRGTSGIDSWCSAPVPRRAGTRRPGRRSAGRAGSRSPGAPRSCRRRGCGRPGRRSGCLDVAGHQEVGVQRMRGPRLACRAWPAPPTAPGPGPGRRTRTWCRCRGSGRGTG